MAGVGALPASRFVRHVARAVADFVLIAFAAFAAGAFLLGKPIVPSVDALVPALVLAAACVLGLEIMGAYRSPASRDTVRTLAAIVIGTFVAMVVLGGVARLDIAIAGLAAYPLVILSRQEWPRQIRTARRGDEPTIIVGSRDSAVAVIRLCNQRRDLPYRAVGCVDDDAAVSDVEGVPVIGRVADLPDLIETYGAMNVIVAATQSQLRLISQVMAACSRTRGSGGHAPTVKVIPNLDDLLSGALQTSRIRDFRLSDLLSRSPVKIDLSLVAPHIENRVVLVTGAGGSIGSELCRQIITFNPQILLLLGHGENSLFAIDNELRNVLGFSRTRVILADVADASRIRRVFGRFRPHLVFHAAAHKHVPILENNVCEAARNNIFGTHTVALAAAASGVAKFVMISTDKAVNPTSVMGATKRVAEIICQSFERRTGTEFVSVRFGNVLGSRGSVIDVFKQQIEAGGPITVTHRDMTRYFMTIPEAVSLVLEAMAIGRDGEVCVMDMGKPVKVVELAENLITLSGLKPYEDIDIVFTAIRPGEKLFEEMLTSRERENPTVSKRLFVAQQERIQYERLAATLHELDCAVRTPDTEKAIACLRTLVPSFDPGNHLLQRDPADVHRNAVAGTKIIAGTANSTAADDDADLASRKGSTVADAPSTATNR